ncbi:DUF3325 domain-containing protein [Cupriavidus basilensis]|nr:DUF3325 domain-containing protein [Cupriavidus basilensis]
MMALSSMPPTLAALASLAFCYAGMASISLAMDRHHGQVRGRNAAPPAAPARWLLRACGWLLLALAALPCLRGWGASIGAVVWAGSVSAGALAFVLLLAYFPRTAAALALPATAFAAASLALPP